MQYLLSAVVLGLIALSYYRDGSTAIFGQNSWFYVAAIGCLLGVGLFAKSRFRRHP